jgi:uncharacterized protein (UPF0261 family)
MGSKTVLLLGAFDTKGEDYAYVEQLILSRGHRVLKVNFGTFSAEQDASWDYGPGDVAAAAGFTLEELHARNDRGHAMTVMSRGAAALVRKLYSEGKFHAILGMGGTGGSSVISAAMRELPIAVPKVLVSTAASGDTSAMVGTRNIVLVPSVVDIAGINRISEEVYRQAAGAVCGMIEMEAAKNTAEVSKPVIAVTMFGNTTKCVERCRERLTALGYEVLVFHCTGTGGRTMEGLVEDGLVEAVLDITTTELADELCGGVFTAGPTRLEAAGKKGVPHLIVPGCLDMVNFGPVETVPEAYRDGKLVVWNPTVTLLRTNPEQNAELGRMMAGKANRAQGPVRFMIPLRGWSILDSPGNEFWWPEADAALISALKDNLRPGIPLTELDMNINDDAFADQAVDQLLEMIKERENHV